MSNSLEQFLSLAEDHEGKSMMIRRFAQFNMAQGLGIDPIEWDNLYADKVAQMVKEDPIILERLADEKTFDETLASLKQRLYH